VLPQSPPRMDGVTLRRWSVTPSRARTAVSKEGVALAGRGPRPAELVILGRSRRPGRRPGLGCHSHRGFGPGLGGELPVAEARVWGGLKVRMPGRCAARARLSSALLTKGEAPDKRRNGDGKQRTECQQAHEGRVQRATGRLAGGVELELDRDRAEQEDERPDCAEHQDPGAPGLAPPGPAAPAKYACIVMSGGCAEVVESTPAVHNSRGTPRRTVLGWPRLSGRRHCPSNGSDINYS